MVAVPSVRLGRGVARHADRLDAASVPPLRPDAPRRGQRAATAADRQEPAPQPAHAAALRPSGPGRRCRADSRARPRTPPLTSAVAEIAASVDAAIAGFRSVVPHGPLRVALRRGDGRRGRSHGRRPSPLRRARASRDGRRSAYATRPWTPPRPSSRAARSAIRAWSSSSSWISSSVSPRRRSRGASGRGRDGAGRWDTWLVSPACQGRVAQVRALRDCENAGYDSRQADDEDRAREAS